MRPRAYPEQDIVLPESDTLPKKDRHIQRISHVIALSLAMLMAGESRAQQDENSDLSVVPCPDGTSMYQSGAYHVPDGFDVAVKMSIYNHRQGDNLAQFIRNYYDPNKCEEVPE